MTQYEWRWYPKGPSWLSRWLSPAAPPHYYGDIVRKLFLTAGLLMLVTLPWFSEYLPVPAIVSVGIILAISLLAGFTNPMQKWVMVFDVIASLVALFIFQYHAIAGFYTIPTLLFAIDQALAILFFFGLYFSAKTLRGAVVKP